MWYSDRLGEIEPAQFQAALDRFGLGQLISASPAPGGNFGQNVFLSTTDGEYVFRGAPFFDWQLPKERLVVELLHDRTDLPVPWPFRHERSPELFGWDYAIMPRLPGEMVNDAPAPDQVALTRAMATALTRMQRATFDRSMDFELTSGAFIPNADGEITHLSRRIEYNLEASMRASDRTSDADAEWVRAVLATSRRFADDGARYCIVHGDFTVANVVASRPSGEWEVTGVFDFMTARIGSAEADLCRQFALHHERRPAAASAFLDAYFAERPPDRGYRTRIPVLLLDERLTLWEWIQRTRPDWWTSDVGLREWVEPVLEAMLAYE